MEDLPPITREAGRLWLIIDLTVIPPMTRAGDFPGRAACDGQNRCGRRADLTLKRPELSPRELAVTFSDERAYFVSGSYFASDPAKWLEERGIDHVAAPNHPQRQ